MPFAPIRIVAPLCAALGLVACSETTGRAAQGDTHTRSVMHEGTDMMVTWTHARSGNAIIAYDAMAPMTNATLAEVIEDVTQCTVRSGSARAGLLSTRATLEVPITCGATKTNPDESSDAETAET